MNRTATAVADRVRAILARQLGLDRGEMTPESDLLDDLGADSLDVAELVMTLEEAFDIQVPDDHVEGMRTVGDVEHYVETATAL